MTEEGITQRNGITISTIGFAKKSAREFFENLPRASLSIWFTGVSVAPFFATGKDTI